MAKAIKRLTAQQIDSLPPGKHPDGHNLYLVVSQGGNRSWAFIYRFNGRQPEAGLGKAGKGGVTLAQARAKAKEGRALLDQRPPVDPLSIWRARPVTSAPTFEEAARDYLALHEPSWKNAKHIQQWHNTLATYCKPLHKLPVDRIATADVLAVLRPIWSRAPETASRLRGRIETVLNSAKADDETRPNVARWRGHLDDKLPSPKAIGKLVKRNGIIATVDRGHHAAMRYIDVPAFVGGLRAEAGIAARGLEFLLLTAARTNEVLGAEWGEIDAEAKTWTVPISRLKTGKKTRQPHVVPLSDRALAILEEMRAIATGTYVFPGLFDGRPLSNMAFLMLLKKRMGIATTVHGLRSAFRDWAGDETHHPREVAEQALGHVITGVEGAYRRGDALRKRRALMDAWAAFCEPGPDDAGAAADNVLPFEAKSVRVAGVVS